MRERAKSMRDSDKHMTQKLVNLEQEVGAYCPRCKDDRTFILTSSAFSFYKCSECRLAVTKGYLDFKLYQEILRGENGKRRKFK